MEKLSAYVDEFLRPLAQAPPSHIRDTTDFTTRLKNLGRVPENSILTTLDVSSLYTNIDTDDGLAIIEEKLVRSNLPQQGLLASLKKSSNLTISHLTTTISSRLRVQQWAQGLHLILQTCIWAGLKMHLYTERNGSTT